MKWFLFILVTLTCVSYAIAMDPARLAQFMDTDADKRGSIGLNEGEGLDLGGRLAIFAAAQQAEDRKRRALLKVKRVLLLLENEHGAKWMTLTSDFNRLNKEFGVKHSFDSIPLGDDDSFEDDEDFKDDESKVSLDIPAFPTDGSIMQLTFENPQDFNTVKLAYEALQLIREVHKPEDLQQIKGKLEEDRQNAFRAKKAETRARDLRKKLSQ